ncbi:hypothetical protein GCM10023149_51890 [Mucilaginibacter gynuensis]|uniref:Aspartyl protease n=1 Tax=Mucilaginibacter gynuensis TaxID=1302236 RepID=A0ABP8HK13_9SPHI
MKYLQLFTALLLVQPAMAQTKLPVIKATSKSVAINDGGFLDKNAWSLSPKIRPDVYTADRTRKAKWVTFYTDIDSIRVKVKPGTKFNFVVLLNGKDSCYTQIASAIPAENKQQKSIVRHDTIPFTLTAYNTIQVKTVFNNTDTLNFHFDASSFDFRLTRDAILKKTNLLTNQADVLAGKAKPDYNNLKKVGKLQMGTMVWSDQEIVPTTFTAHDMDGRFGWNLFEGKQVELDYDKNLMIIHSKLPETKGYVKSKLDFIRSFVSAVATLKVGDKQYTGKFLFDNGSDQALILDGNWMKGQGVPADMKVIKSSTLTDPRGTKYEIKLVEIPLLSFSGFNLTNVPAYVLSNKNPVGFEINYFGNDFLKRFNVIFDFKNDNLYLKPNKLMGIKYRESS